MNSIILLTIFGIIFICMMLIVKEDNYLAEESAKDDVSFNIIILSYVLNACKGDEESSKITEIQHLTCQPTRAGTPIKTTYYYW